MTREERERLAGPKPEARPGYYVFAQPMPNGRVVWVYRSVLQQVRARAMAEVSNARRHAERERRRKRALDMLSNDMPVSEIARVLGIHRDSVSRLLRGSK